MKILHTADWQLGKPYARVTDPDKRASLRNARIEAIHRITSIAKEEKVDLVVVAGDVFDSFTAEKSVVSAACAAIGQIPAPVFAIPGNHDHGGPGCLWEQDFFLKEQEALAPNFRILLEPTPVETDSVILFPCPLLRRHEAGDPTAWLREIEINSEKPRIILAHGSTQGFDSSSGDDEEDHLGAPNLIALDRLPSGEFDYVALGDWHGTKEISPLAWYSGTHEIDRFPKGDDNDPGNILITTVERGRPPSVEKISSGALSWHVLSYTLAADDDVEHLDSLLTETIGSRAGSDLLHLTIDGALGFAASASLDQLIEKWEARLVRLKLKSDIALSPSDEEAATLIDRPEDPLIGRVASGLLETASGPDEEAAEVARIALRELYTADLS